MLKRFISFFLVVTALFLLFSCANAPKVGKQDRVLGFEEGIIYLARDIDSQFSTNNQLVNKIMEFKEKKKLMLDAFLDGNSGQALTINKASEGFFNTNLSNRFKIIQLETLSDDENVDYVLSGILEYDHKSTSQNAFHFYVAVYEMNTGKILASSDALIEIPEYKPVSIYADSPIFLRDDKLEDLTISIKRKPGEQVSGNYLSYLGVKKYLILAEQAYEKGDNEGAFKYYSEAEKLPNGKNLTVYSGLYNTARRLNKKSAAEQHFSELIATSISEKKKIEIKLLFKVNSSDFIDIGDVSKQYDMWLRQITKQLKNQKECIKIIGHSSHTGKEQYNKTLSRKRAQMVQRVLAEKYPEIMKKSEIVGNGYADNIVGSGTDDAKDAIDRRVEFKLIECIK